MRFTYTTQAPTYRAGVMTLGHHVTPNMIVPPQAKSYSVEGICSAQCTEEVSNIANKLCTLLESREHNGTQLSTNDVQSASSQSAETLYWDPQIWNQEKVHACPD